MPFLGQPEDIQPVKVIFKLTFMKINNRSSINFMQGY